MSLVSWVTLDVLNVETSLRFHLVLSVFTYDAVGSLDYSKSPLTDARTISVVFAIAGSHIWYLKRVMILQWRCDGQCD